MIPQQLDASNGVAVSRTQRFDVERGLGIVLIELD